MSVFSNPIILNFTPVEVKKCKIEKVSIIARITNAIFGSPNWRRANGIISTSFDIAGVCNRALQKLFKYKSRTPVYVLDPIDDALSDELPRIWLSEAVANTRFDDGRRVFVESYPNVFDFRGDIALELGDRYLGEGLKSDSKLNVRDKIDCFKAAEILYLHALRRGSRCAVSRLKFIYDRDLCLGDYWLSNREKNAKHAKKRSHFNDCA